MSLQLTSESERQLHELQYEAADIIAYKVVKPDSTSPFYDHMWEFGINISTRPLRALTAEEIESGFVSLGFSLFLHKYDAEAFVKNYLNDGVILRVNVNPADVVAVGIYTSNEPIMVAMKALVP